MITLYTTPTCVPCRVAKARLTKASVPYQVIDLTTEESAPLLKSLKQRKNATHVQTPIFEYEGELFDMTHLTTLIESAQKAAA